MATANAQFIEAVRKGRVKDLRALLRDHPDLDVNHAANGALHVVCHWKVAKLLLEQPAIDVNVQNEEGQTPLLACCWNDQEDIARLLLKVPQVDAALADAGNCTPL